MKQLTASAAWEMVIVKAELPVEDLGSLAYGDIDGDGVDEIVTGGTGNLLWVRRDTAASGSIAKHRMHVGLTLEDIDGDGRLEVVGAYHCGDDTVPGERAFTVSWFKPAVDADGRVDLSAPWQEYVIDADGNGGSHDILFYDIDGDGVREMIVNDTGPHRGFISISRRMIRPSRGGSGRSTRDILVKALPWRTLMMMAWWRL